MKLEKSPNTPSLTRKGGGFFADPETEANFLAAGADRTHRQTPYSPATRRAYEKAPDSMKKHDWPGGDEI
jgi:hypothetical protein